MTNTTSKWSRYGRHGFVRITQADNDNYDGDEGEQRQLSGRERFRETVQQVIRQTPSSASHKTFLLSAHTSPALSDTSLIGEDYISLPIQQFDEVDLTDAHGQYAEVAGCYGPEVVGDNTEVGQGLEVCVNDDPLALSPGGLYTDDRVQDTAYRGSERLIDEPLPLSSPVHDYKPVALRWQFIVIIFGGLIAFLALSGVALHFLPDASEKDGVFPAFQNITEIRKRSGSNDNTLRHGRHFPKPSNGTEPNTSTRTTTTTTKANTSKAQSGQPSTTPSPTTKVTAPGNSPTETPTPSPIPTDDSKPPWDEPSHYTKTPNHNTAHPTPNDPDDSPGSGESASPEATPTEVEGSPYVPPEITTDSTGGPPNWQPSQPVWPNPLQGPSAGATPLLGSGIVLNLGPTPPSPPESTPTGPGEQPIARPSGQGLDLLINGGSSNQPDAQSGGQPVGQVDGQANGQLDTQSDGQSDGQVIGQSPEGQPGDQRQDGTGRQTEEQSGNPQIGAGDAGNMGSSPTADAVASMVTSGHPLPATDTTKTTKTSGNIRINTGVNTVMHADIPATSGQLPGPPEQAPVVDDHRAFTTLTITQMTETPPPPITTVFTTSTSITDGSFVEVVMTTTLFGHVKAADPLTDFVTTTTYKNGTVSTISKDVYDMIWTSIEYDAAGNPTKTEFIHVLHSAQETTLRDSLGFPTATLDYWDVESVATLYDSNNVATATVTTTVPETAEAVTLRDANGKATKTTMILQPIPTDTKDTIVTPTPGLSPGSNDQRVLNLRRASDGIYFAGLMLPTLFAIGVSTLIRILNRNVKLYQGFHALASERGASAAESLCLGTTGPASILNGFRPFRDGNYLLGLTSVLVLLSALVVPMSSEVTRLTLQGPQCLPDEMNKPECSVTLGVYPVTAQVLLASLVVLTVGVIAVALLLRRWKTGVECNPWSISQMAQLAAGTDMRKVLERLRRRRYVEKRISPKQFIDKLRGKRLGLRGWEENGTRKYSVLILSREDDAMNEKPATKASRSVAFADPEKGRWQQRRRWLSEDFTPFFMLSWTGRIMFLLFLSGVLIAVLTYDIVARGSEYQRGMAGKAVGVRFLFSGAGVLITFAWGSFFNAVAFLSPYKLLRRRRLNKGEAISLSPPTDPFTGLWLAFVPSRRDLYLGVVAATAIFSELLPLFLSSIPCNGVQLERAEIICVYLSVATLSIMMLVVGASFFIDWPSAMGADPSTIAGAMYAAHVFSVEQPLRGFIKDKRYALDFF